MSENLIEQARAILRRNDRGGYTVPTERLYPFQWNWDSGFVAMGGMTFDEDPDRPAFGVGVVDRGGHRPALERSARNPPDRIHRGQGRGRSGRRRRDAARRADGVGPWGRGATGAGDRGGEGDHGRRRERATPRA